MCDVPYLPPSPDIRVHVTSPSDADQQALARLVAEAMSRAGGPRPPL